MKIEHEAMVQVIGDLVKKDEFISLLFEFDARKTREAIFAYHCDKLEADLQAKVYQDMGCYHSLDDQNNNVVFKSAKVQQMLIDEMITAGHARAILAISDKEKQETVAMRVFDEKLSVRETESLVKRILNPQKEKKQKTTTAEDAIYESLEEKMKGIMGTRVLIHRKKNDKGKIEIEYYSKDELERIIDLFESIN